MRWPKENIHSSQRYFLPVRSDVCLFTDLPDDERKPENCACAMRAHTSNAFAASSFASSRIFEMLV